VSISSWIGGRERSVSRAFESSPEDARESANIGKGTGWIKPRGGGEGVPEYWLREIESWVKTQTGRLRLLSCPRTWTEEKRSQEDEARREGPERPGLSDPAVDARGIAQ